MTSAELLLTALVALLVFGPSKLPMLAKHLQQLLHVLSQLKQQLNVFWQQQLNEAQLLENRRKAKDADARYRLETEDKNHDKQI